MTSTSKRRRIDSFGSLSSRKAEGGIEEALERLPARQPLMQRAHKREAMQYFARSLAHDHVERERITVRGAPGTLHRLTSLRLRSDLPKRAADIARMFAPETEQFVNVA
jgi:hypothetical protein